MKKNLTTTERQILAELSREPADAAEESNQARLYELYCQQSVFAKH